MMMLEPAQEEEEEEEEEEEFPQGNINEGTINFQNFRTPNMFTVITLKFKQRGFPIEKFV